MSRGRDFTCSQFSLVVPLTAPAVAWLGYSIFLAQSIQQRYTPKTWRCSWGDFEKVIEAAQRGNVADVTAIVHGHAELINRRDQRGATALHHAAFGGHRGVVQALVEQGAEINARDHEFGATPAGWAIEYLRELDGFLAIELDDLA